MPDPLFDVIAIGDMCVDLVVDVGEAPVRFGQAEQWVCDYLLEMGGAGCIFACQAAKLGLRVGILGRVGDDSYGHLVLRRLKESGVDTRFVEVDCDLKTGLGIALCRPEGDRAILTYAGSLNAVYPEDVTDDFLRSSRHFHYSSYYLQTHLRPHVPEMLGRAKGMGLTVSLDTNWDPDERWDCGAWEALRYTDLFLPNAKEALAIAGRKVLREALADLLKHVPIVAVKRGDKGALLGTREGIKEMPVETVSKVVDSVGAGDSFDAGFLAGWLRGLSIEQCASLGNLCGRATVMAAGGIRGQLTVEHLPDWAEAVRSARARL